MLSGFCCQLYYLPPKHVDTQIALPKDIPHFDAAGPETFVNVEYGIAVSLSAMRPHCNTVCSLYVCVSCASASV